MWDLSSSTRDWTPTPCIGRWSLNHWTEREIPSLLSLLPSPAPAISSLFKSISHSPCPPSPAPSRGVCVCVYYTHSHRISTTSQKSLYKGWIAADHTSLRDRHCTGGQPSVPTHRPHPVRTSNSCLSKLTDFHMPWKGRPSGLLENTAKCEW